MVTVVGNWFGKGKRGLIFGLWNSHTSLGNILGSLIAGSFLETNWGLSFIVPGAVIGMSGFLVFLFLVPKPQHVHCTLPDHHETSTITSDLSNDSSDFPSVSGFFISQKAGLSLISLIFILLDFQLCGDKEEEWTL